MTTGVRIKLDSATQRWFDKRPFGTQTTVAQCAVCGLFYKPELGHKCKMKGAAEDDRQEQAQGHR